MRMSAAKNVRLHGNGKHSYARDMKSETLGRQKV